MCFRLLLCCSVLHACFTLPVRYVRSVTYGVSPCCVSCVLMLPMPLSGVHGTAVYSATFACRQCHLQSCVHPALFVELLCFYSLIHGVYPAVYLCWAFVLVNAYVADGICRPLVLLTSSVSDGLFRPIMMYEWYMSYGLLKSLHVMLHACCISW